MLLWLFLVVGVGGEGDGGGGGDGDGGGGGGGSGDGGDGDVGGVAVGIIIAYLMIFIFHISWLTFGIAAVTILFFSLLERYGFSVAVFMRWFRTFIAGPRKVSQPRWKR